MQATQSAQDAVNSTGVVKPAQSNLPTSTAQPSISNPQSATPSEPIDGPLSVVIESPGDNVIVNQSTIEITGQADPDTVITVNETIVLVEKDRRFRLKVDLVEGINLIEIIASDLDENQEVFYLTVDYEREP